MIVYNNKEVIPKYNGNDLLKILKNGIILWEGIGDIPTAASYIQDGLIFQLDGIERGNSDTAWIDLIGGRIFNYNNCILNKDNVEFNGVDSYAANDSELILTSDYAHLETCMYREETNENSVLLTGGSASGSTNNQIVPYITMGVTYATHMISVFKNRPGLTKPIKKAYTISASTHKNTSYAKNATYQKGYINNEWVYGIGTYVNTTYTGNATVGGEFKDGVIYRPFKGKVYSIRLYDRELTAEERAHNLFVDYQRFGLDLMEKITINLVNDLGEPITEALIKINGSTFTYTKPTTLFVPKATEYSIWFNGTKYHRAPEAMLGLKGSQDITAVYTYTGLEDGFIFEITGKSVSCGLYDTNITEIDWGDGQIESFTGSTTSFSHTYSTSDTYIAKFKGTASDDWYISSLGTGISKILQFPININNKIDREISTSSGAKLNYLAPAILNNPLILDDYFSQYKGSLSIPYYITNPNTDTIHYLWCVNGQQFAYNDRYQNKVKAILWDRYNTYYFNGRVPNVEKVYLAPKEFANIFGTRTGGVPPWYWLTYSDVNLTKFEVPTQFFEWFGNAVVFQFDSLDKWGMEEDVKEYMVRSLINNTIDLTQSIECKATIRLDSNQKSLLTEEEIAQITAKGYTIA